MISLRNIEKFYETGIGKTFVLRRITFDIKPGEFVSVAEESGLIVALGEWALHAACNQLL